MTTNTALCPNEHAATFVADSPRGAVYQCDACANRYRFVVHTDATIAADKALIEKIRADRLTARKQKAVSSPIAIKGAVK